MRTWLFRFYAVSGTILTVWASRVSFLEAYCICGSTSKSRGIGDDISILICCLNMIMALRVSSGSTVQSCWVEMVTRILDLGFQIKI